MNSVKNKLQILIIFVSAIVFSSCTHSDFLVSSIKNSYDASWNKDSTAFAFVSIEKIFRPATGLAKFPDGGISKTVFNRVAVYHYNIKRNTLTQTGEYQNIGFMGEISIRALRIIVNDTGVLYKLPAISNYQINKAYRFAVNQKDSIKINNNIEQAKRAYQYNFKTKTISIFDTTLFNKLDTLPQIIHGNNAEDKYIKNITLAQRGILLKNIYPQSMRRYKKYILEGRGSKDIRDAIVEQEFPKLSNKEIKNLIDEMTEFKQKLNEKSKNTVNYKIELYSDRYDEYYSYMIKKFEKLNKLELNKISLKDIPNVIFDLKKLQILSLTNNKIKNIPKEIFTLNNLKVIYLMKNKIKNISEKFQLLDSLKVLGLSNNPLINKELCNLQHSKIEVLYCNSCKLKTFPICLNSMPYLQIIDISNNKLKTLPDTLKGFKKLWFIQISNKTKYIPNFYNNNNIFISKI